MLDYSPRVQTVDARARTAATRGEVRRSAALAVLGAWTIVVPYLGRAVGLGVSVASRVEVVDHVVPGTLIAATGMYLAVGSYRGAAPGWSRLIGGGVCFLAGFWVLATHVPLISQAIEGKAAWEAALWHASTAIPLVALSLWIVLREA
jgi:hypothetical protein